MLMSSPLMPMGPEAMVSTIRNTVTTNSAAKPKASQSCPPGSAPSPPVSIRATEATLSANPSNSANPGRALGNRRANSLLDTFCRKKNAMARKA